MRFRLCCVFVCLLAAASARAQCRVEGVIMFATDRPMANVAVRLEGPELRPPQTTTTDAEGRYVFAEVKPGVRVHIVALQAGRPVAQAYALVTLPVETVNLREELVPIGEAASSTFVTATEGPSGELAGYVRSSAGEPIAAARVTLGNTMVSTTTDAAGRYLLARLRPGLHIDLRVAAQGYQPATAEVTVVERQRVATDFAMAGVGTRALPQLSTVDVAADGSAVSLRTEDAAGLPSVGRDDVFHALQFLPAVAGSRESSLGWYVRGGTPDQNLVTIDGITLYQLAAPLGAFGAYNPDAFQSAELAMTPFDASAGGRLSSAFRLTGQQATGGRATGFVEASALGLNTQLAVPIGDRVSVSFATRRSPPTSIYDDELDRFGTTSGTSLRTRVSRFSGGSFADAPVNPLFRDMNGRVTAKLSAADRVSVTWYDGRNDANDGRNLPVPAPDTSVIAPPQASVLPADAINQVSDAGRWTAMGIGGTWVHQWSPAAATTVTIGHSNYSSRHDQSWLVTSPTTLQDYSADQQRGGSAGLTEANDVKDTTVRVDGSFAVGFAHALRVGGERTELDAQYTSTTEALALKANGSTTSQLTPLLATAGSGALSAVYAQDSWRPLSKLTLSPGLRLARYDRTGDTFVEPRLSAAFELLPQWRLKGGWSVDHQVANLVTREDLVHGDGAFWSLSDGASVPVPRARQAIVGSVLDLPYVLVDVEAYYKTYDALTMFAPRLFPGTAVASGSSLLYQGSGKARGIELLAQQRVDRNTLWIGYTLSRVEYSYPALEAETFAAPHDRANEFKVADSLQIVKGWSVGAAFVAASGQPYTPASGTRHVWFPSGYTAEAFTFGAKDSARLPAYHRLDVSTERLFVIRGVRATLGATLFNVYDRKNLLGYDYDTAGSALSGHEVYLMRRALNAFLRVGF